MDRLFSSPPNNNWTEKSSPTNFEEGIISQWLKTKQIDWLNLKQAFCLVKNVILFLLVKIIHHVCMAQDTHFHHYKKKLAPKPVCLTWNEKKGEKHFKWRSSDRKIGKVRNWKNHCAVMKKKVIVKRKTHKVVMDQEIIKTAKQVNPQQTLPWDKHKCFARKTFHGIKIVNFFLNKIILF